MSRPYKTILFFVAAAFMLVTALFAFNQRVQSAQVQSSSDWDLNQLYEMGEVQTIPAIKDNLSGITYQPETDHLFAVTNGPETLYELSKQGEIIRTISLTGFQDTESIDYIGNGQFVVAEERRNQLVVFTLDDNTTEVHHQESKRLPLDVPDKENQGFEAVAWSETLGFFILKEEPPTLLHHLPHDAESAIDLKKLNQQLPSTTKDFAGISVYQQQDKTYLLVLSEASNQLSLIDLSGQILSEMSLTHPDWFFLSLMEQPEGVAVDADQNIYLVGEPNQFLVMKKRAQPNS